MKSSFAKPLFLLWAALCISIFIRYAGSVSILHGISLADWTPLFTNPNRIDAINYLITFSWSFSGLVIFCIACVSAGALLLPSMKEGMKQKPGSTLSRIASLGTALLMGQGLLSIIFITLAELHALTPAYTIPIMAAALAIGAIPLARFLSTHPIKWNSGLSNLFDHGNRLLSLLVASTVIFALLYSTSRLGYDSVALYFSDAKLTAMTHSIRYFVGDSFIVSFFQTGIQYAAIIQLFGDQAARMYSWACGLIVIIFSIALGEELGLTKKARLYLIALLMSSTAFVDLLGDGKIDLASTAPSIAAVYWLIISTKYPSKTKYLITGFLTGLSMVARPFNIFLLGLFILLYYVQSQLLRGRGNGSPAYKSFLMPVFWMSIGVMALLAYHLATNWIILGDPIAPIKNYQNINTGNWQWTYNPNLIWLFRLIYPFTVTFFNTPQSLGDISPLFVSFLPAFFVKDFREGVFSSKNRSIVLIATSLTLLAWITIFFTVFEIRYVFFLWIILCTPIALIIEKTSESKDRFFRLSVNFALIVLMTFMIARILFISIGTYSPLDKQGNPHCPDHPICNFLKPVNEVASQGERVLTLNAFRYYLRTDLFACSTTHEEYSSLLKASRENSDAFWSEAYRQGYKYVTYEENYSTRHLGLTLIPDPYNTPSWLSLQPIYGEPGDPEVAYQIKVTNPPLKVDLNCQKTLSGDWEVSEIQR
jgi:hypothetical protein